MSQGNRCSCPIPPGGEVICEAHQMPFFVSLPPMASVMLFVKLLCKRPVN